MQQKEKQTLFPHFERLGLFWILIISFLDPKTIVCTVPDWWSACRSQTVQLRSIGRLSSQQWNFGLTYRWRPFSTKWVYPDFSASAPAEHELSDCTVQIRPSPNPCRFSFPLETSENRWPWIQSANHPCCLRRESDQRISPDSSPYSKTSNEKNSWPENSFVFLQLVSNYSLASNPAVRQLWIVAKETIDQKFD